MKKPQLPTTKSCPAMFSIRVRHEFRNSLKAREGAHPRLLRVEEIQDSGVTISPETGPTRLTGGRVERGPNG